MYEELEMWNAEMAKTVKWIEEKKLQKEIAKEFKLPVSDNSSKLVSDYDKKEFDEWMHDLIKKNGTTEY